MFHNFSGSSEIKLVHPTIDFNNFLLYSPWCAFASPSCLRPFIITDLTCFGWATLRVLPFSQFCYRPLCGVPIPPVFLYTFTLNQFTRLWTWVTEAQTYILSYPGSAELWHRDAVEGNEQASHSGQNQSEITHIRGTTMLWALAGNLSWTLLKC